MCTLTWLRRDDGYVLLMNRDELRGRGPEEPARVLALAGRRVIAPRDTDFGGTWIAVNESGLTVCILNGYEPSDALRRDVRSRGLLVLDLASAGSRAEALARLRDDDPARYRSFVLVLVDPAQPVAVCAWNGTTFEVRPDAEDALPLLSASIRSAAVRAARRATFADLRAEHGGVTEGMLRAYHRSHVRGPGPGSPCMHHERAETRSHSVVTVAADTVRFEHVEGPPCRAVGGHDVTLERCAPEDLA